MTKFGLFIFRRDFRITDNYALYELSKQCDKIIPIFIFDPFQINSSKQNQYYKSDNSIKFMIESLDDLDKELKKLGSRLFYFYGDPVKVVSSIMKETNIDIVGFNADFSKYSKIRDEKIKKLKSKFVINEDDLTLMPIDSVLKSKGVPYLTFGTFHKLASKIKVGAPFPKVTNFIQKTFKLKNEKFPKLNLNSKIKLKGGRCCALKILNNLKKFGDYNSKRDVVTYDTTKLSGYLKFGCVSIRECYELFKKLPSSASDLTKQLYWRCFYFVLAKNNKNLYGHIESRFEKVKWITGKELEQKGRSLWEGKTGYPIIDAAVRELNETGFMNNRARLLVANFAVKILHIDPFGNGPWSGQLYFSKMLIDCCYANNYGNWMWILGPYDKSGFRFGRKNTFGGRVFKDIIKFKKWDPELKYVRKWLPEMKNLSDKEILSYSKNRIVDFDKQIDLWYKMTTK